MSTEVLQQQGGGLHATVSGNPDGEAIVFLHGGGLASWMWRPQAERLADYRCYLVDMPETGRSQGVGPFTMAGAAAAVASLIREQVPGGRAHLVGLSLGAQVGLQLLATDPGVVDRAVLSGPLVLPMRGSRLQMTLLRWLLPTRHWEAGIRLNLRSLGLSGEWLPDLRETVTTLTDDGIMRMVAENQRFRVPPGLERCAVPTLIIVGSKEPKVMRDSARAAAAAVPGAQGAFARGLGHVWNLEDPDRFSALVRAWLTGGDWPDRIEPIT